MIPEARVKMERVGDEHLHVTVSFDDAESAVVFIWSNIAGKLAKANGYYGRYVELIPPIDTESPGVTYVFQKSRRRSKPNDQLQLPDNEDRGLPANETLWAEDLRGREEPTEIECGTERGDSSHS